MNKIVSIKNTNAIFLATVLVLGTITTFYPSYMLGAQAESYYGMDDRYDSYESKYPSDNSYKSKDSSNTIIKKVKCNNINSNNNGVDVNLGIPNNDALVEAQSEDESQATTANGWGYGERNGYKQNSNDFRFVCINNNDNENNIVVVNETTPIPPPPSPDTITCEECFEETLSPLAFAQLKASLAEGQITITVGGESITPRSLTELCEALQDATALEIFEIFNSIAGGDRAINIIFCLGTAFGFDTTALQ